MWAAIAHLGTGWFLDRDIISVFSSVGLLLSLLLGPYDPLEDSICPDESYRFSTPRAPQSKQSSGYFFVSVSNLSKILTVLE